jgi:hypothetical protein
MWFAVIIIFFFCISGDTVPISWAVLRFGVAQKVCIPKCIMHYLCPRIATCPSIRNLRTSTLSGTSCATFKVRTAVLLKIEVFRDVDATGHPSIFDTDTHHVCSCAVWLSTSTCVGGPLWVQLWFIVVDTILDAGFFFDSLSNFWLLKKGSCSLNSSVFYPLAAVKRVTTQSGSLLSDLHGCAVMIVQSIIGCVWTACSSCFQTAALRGALALWYIRIALGV